MKKEKREFYLDLIKLFADNYINEIGYDMDYWSYDAREAFWSFCVMQNISYEEITEEFDEYYHTKPWKEDSLEYRKAATEFLGVFPNDVVPFHTYRWPKQ